MQLASKIVLHQFLEFSAIQQKAEKTVEERAHTWKEVKSTTMEVTSDVCDFPKSLSCHVSFSEAILKAICGFPYHCSKHPNSNLSQSISNQHYELLRKIVGQTHSTDIVLYTVTSDELYNIV